MASLKNQMTVVSAIFLLALIMPLALGFQEANPAPAAGQAAGAEPAEQADLAAESAAAGTSPAADDSILNLILGTGLTGIAFMVALGLFSITGVTVAIERLVHTRRDCIVPASFLTGLKQVAEAPHSTPADLKAVCDAAHDVPAANILRAGLQRSGRPFPEIEKAMEDVAAREMGALRSRVRPLTVAGSVTPLIGLLGTVVGMIIAFKTASQSGLGKGEMLAQGIYMALMTTAAGLVIAIPSTLCAAYFNGRLEKYFREIDAALMSTFPCFARAEKRMSAGSTMHSDE